MLLVAAEVSNEELVRQYQLGCSTPDTARLRGSVVAGLLEACPGWSPRPRMQDAATALFAQLGGSIQPLASLGWLGNGIAFPGHVRC